MIVKNEVRVLPRCLASVRPFIASWAIVDTGSSDGTQELVRRELARIPGRLEERPWRDFATNRNEALDLARTDGDAESTYALLMDADEVLVAAPGFSASGLTADGYLLQEDDLLTDTSHYRLKLIRLAAPWRWHGVVHEWLESQGPARTQPMPTLKIRSHYDGARNADRIQKFEGDVQVLQKALEAEPTHTRYAFYLAQSLRGAQRYEEALDAYERRIELGGDPEEIWYSMYQLALIQLKLRRPRGHVVQALVRAHETRPCRAEPLWVLACAARRSKDYRMAYEAAKSAAAIPMPDDLLFMERDVYEWRALDELALAAHHLGHREEALATARKVLACETLPAKERARIEKNLEWLRSA
jgi:tetratricopeptide (TPR) repeat protein